MWCTEQEGYEWRAESPQEKTEGDHEALGLLKKVMPSGVWRWVKEIYRDAERHGIPTYRLRKSRKKLRIKIRRVKDLRGRITGTQWMRP